MGRSEVSSKPPCLEHPRGKRKPRRWPRAGKTLDLTSSSRSWLAGSIADDDLAVEWASAVGESGDRARGQTEMPHHCNVFCTGLYRSAPGARSVTSVQLWYFFADFKKKCALELRWHSKKKEKDEFSASSAAVRTSVGGYEKRKRSVMFSLFFF